jgi:hypothetical protein
MLSSHSNMAGADSCRGSWTTPVLALAAARIGVVVIPLWVLGAPRRLPRCNTRLLSRLTGSAAGISSVYFRREVA